MGQIVKLPFQASKLGYKRVRKRRAVENPDQLDLFPSGKAQILSFNSGLSCFERALLRDESGDVQAAAELYATAIAEEDCVADAYCNLGILETQKGNIVKAFDCFTSSLKHSPRHSEAHYNLANLYFEVNDFRLAQLHYEMTTEVEPEFANAHFNLALVQAINNDLAASAKSLATYRSLVTEEESRIAGELLEDLKKSFSSEANDSKRRLL
jgi:tetratricopeptide (TPR) repeat protein